MDESALSPSAIIVQADIYHIYARNPAGDYLARSDCRMLADSFDRHPQLDRLIALEQQFWSWARQHPSGQTGESWREFHLQGLILSRRLADLMRPLDIPVYYHSSHPALRQSSPLKMGPF
ncbi:MAG: hypothetical protein Q8J78_01890 [Moraxellaceae bacterium]|nr:hypothetical protein [Moraxellaceae bacterium]